MNTNKKLALSLVIFVLVVAIAVLSIVAVFAAQNHNVLSNVSVKYKASTEIEGSVSAKYYIGDDDEGTDMTTNGQPDGDKVITFHAADSPLEAATLNPQGNIEFEFPKTFVVFEYKFVNGLGQPIATDYKATLTYSGTAENISVLTATSEEPITNFSTILNQQADATSFTTSFVVEHDETDYSAVQYMYVKLEVSSPSIDASFNGTFSWDLSLLKPTLDKLSFTLLTDHYGVRRLNSSITGEVVIPQKYNNIPVTEIYNSTGNYSGGAFYETKITSVFIPKSITKIGFCSFYNCSELTEIDIPENITYLGDQAFFGCALTKIIYNSKKITNPPSHQWQIFANLKSSNVKVVFGNKVEEIPQYLFNVYTSSYTKPKVTSVIIGNSVKTIGEYAFIKLALISTVKIPDSVDDIGRHAFEGCTNLKTVYLGSGVTSIGMDAFYECTNLLEVNYNGTLKQWCENYITAAKTSTSSDGHLETYILRKESALYIQGKKIEGELEIPDDIEKINSCAFKYIILTNIKIGKNVEHIGDSAFNSSSSGDKYESIIVDEQNKYYTSRNNSGEECNIIIEIATSALKKGCKNSTIPDDGCVTSIYKTAFSYVEDLNDIVIPDCITNIGKSSFYNSGLININLGDGVTEIGENAFYYSKNLKSVTIGSKVNKIQSSAFSGCESLNEVVVDSETIYVAISSSYSSNAYLTYYLKSGSGQIKVLDTIDASSNSYVTTNFNLNGTEKINGKTYNVYIKK